MTEGKGFGRVGSEKERRFRSERQRKRWTKEAFSSLFSIAPRDECCGRTEKMSRAIDWHLDCSRTLLTLFIKERNSGNKSGKWRWECFISNTCNSRCYSQHSLFDFFLHKSACFLLQTMRRVLAKKYACAIDWRFHLDILSPSSFVA